MGTTVTVNNIEENVPATGDSGWGPDTNDVVVKIANNLWDDVAGNTASGNKLTASPTINKVLDKASLVINDTTDSEILPAAASVAYDLGLEIDTNATNITNNDTDIAKVLVTTPVSGNLPSFNGTDGTLQDSGFVASDPADKLSVSALEDTPTDVSTTAPTSAWAWDRTLDGSGRTDTNWYVTLGASSAEAITGPVSGTTYMLDTGTTGISTNHEITIVDGTWEVYYSLCMRIASNAQVASYTIIGVSDTTLVSGELANSKSYFSQRNSDDLYSTHTRKFIYTASGTTNLTMTATSLSSNINTLSTASDTSPFIFTARRLF